MKRIIIALFILFFILFCIYNITTRKHKQEAALERFKVKFSGVVLNKSEISGSYGIYYLKTVSCSVEEYDPRLNEEFYLLVANKKNAELVYPDYSEFDINDSIVIDGDKKIISVFNSNGLKWNSELSLSDYGGNIREKLKALHKIKW